jgi:hypothetical protein
MNFLQHVTEFFKDEPAFEKNLSYGQAIHQGDKSFLDVQDEL